MIKKLLNRTEAAEYLGLCRGTLLRWHKIGCGPRPKRTPGGLLYYSLASLDAFLATITEESEGFQEVNNA